MPSILVSPRVMVWCLRVNTVLAEDLWPSAFKLGNSQSPWVTGLTCRYPQMDIHIIDTYACPHKNNFCKESVLVVFTYLPIVILSQPALLSGTLPLFLPFFPPSLFLITSVFLFQVSLKNFLNFLTKRLEIHFHFFLVYPIFLPILSIFPLLRNGCVNFIYWFLYQLTSCQCT